MGKLFGTLTALSESSQGDDRLLQGCLSPSWVALCHLLRPKACSREVKCRTGNSEFTPRCALSVRASSDRVSRGARALSRPVGGVQGGRRGGVRVLCAACDRLQDAPHVLPGLLHASLRKTLCHIASGQDTHGARAFSQWRFPARQRRSVISLISTGSSQYPNCCLDGHPKQVCSQRLRCSTHLRGRAAPLLPGSEPGHVGLQEGHQRALHLLIPALQRAQHCTCTRLQTLNLACSLTHRSSQICLHSCKSVACKIMQFYKW